MAAGSKTARNRTTEKRNITSKGGAKQTGTAKPMHKSRDETKPKFKSPMYVLRRTGGRTDQLRGNVSKATRGAPHPAATPTSDMDLGAARERGPKSMEEVSGKAKGGRPTAQKREKK